MDINSVCLVCQQRLKAGEVVIPATTVLVSGEVRAEVYESPWYRPTFAHHRCPESEPSKGRPAKAMNDRDI